MQLTATRILCSCKQTQNGDVKSEKQILCYPLTAELYLLSQRRSIFSQAVGTNSLVTPLIPVCEEEEEDFKNN